MKTTNVFVEICRLACLSNYSIFLKSRDHFNDIFKVIEKSPSGLIEFGVIQEDGGCLEVFVDKLINLGIFVWWSNNEIRFKLKNFQFVIYVYRKFDTNYCAVYLEQASGLIFSILGAKLKRPGLSGIFNFKVDFYVMLSRLIQYLFSKKYLMKILKQNYHVDFVNVNNIISNEMYQCNFMFDKSHCNGGDQGCYSVINNKSILINRNNLIKYTMNPSDLLYVIEVISDVFNANGVEAYLSAGTLLGAVRNKGFIPWDYDADLASKEIFFDKALVASQELVCKGFSVYYSDIWNTIGVYYKGVTVDIDFYRSESEFLTIPMKNINNFFGKFFYYLEWVIVYNKLSTTRSNKLNDVWMAFIRDTLIGIFNNLNRSKRIALASFLCALSKRTKNSVCVIEIPADYISPLIHLCVFNRSWLIPKKFDEYLTLYYGDWMVERKKFSYYDGDAKPLTNVLNRDRSWDYK